MIIVVSVIGGLCGALIIYYGISYYCDVREKAAKKARKKRRRTRGDPDGDLSSDSDVPKEPIVI